METQSVKSSPRDVFMYLLATLSLYFSAGSVINLLLRYIEVRFPDQLNPDYAVGEPIRWSLALLLIIFPVYLWVSRFLHKELVQNPQKSEIKIRRWLLHFTLFVAALLIIGDLVALIYNFLQGEITVRFLLKVISVLAVAAAVFWYYLYDLRKIPGTFSFRAKIFSWGISVAVGIIAVGGIFIAGSPFKQRLVKFDQQKVNDLQTIQGQIVNYWMQKERIPAALGELRDDISGFIPPLDPQSGAEYGYRTTGNLSFELCAEFNFSSEESKLGAATRPYAVPVGFKGTGDNWTHGAGKVCFSRLIDPELYRPKSNSK
jgi:hypothetical protein